MHYVYVLQSKSEPDRYCVGLTGDPERRLREHNAGKSVHTNKHRPWEISVCVSFSEYDKAAKFERYLKSGSGRAFAKRHF